MKKRKIIFAMLGVLCFTLTACSNKVEDENKYTGTLECESFFVTSEISGELSKINVDQGSEVKENDLIAQIDKQMYEIQKRQAEGAVESMQAKYDSISEDADENIKKQAEGALKEAKCGLDIAKLNISKCDIKGEKSGIVTDVLIHKGEMVQPGTNIIKAIDVNEKYIKIYLEESKRDKVQLNNIVNVYYKDKKVSEGKIVYISPESEFTPRNTQTKQEKEDTVFQVKVELLGNNIYSPGTLMDVEIK